MTLVHALTLAVPPPPHPGLMPGAGGVSEPVLVGDRSDARTVRVMTTPHTAPPPCAALCLARTCLSADLSADTSPAQGRTLLTLLHPADPEPTAN